MATVASPLLSLLTQRLTLILGEVCRAVAARGGRDHSLIPLVNMAWKRINRTAQLFERLMVRIASGRIASERAAPVRRAGPARAAAARDPAAFRLSRKFCWLVVLMPETASLGSQLRHWLDSPEMVALLAAEPRAVKILRPVCRMLGVAHPAIGLREPASAGPAPVRRTRPGAGPAVPQAAPVRFNLIVPGSPLALGPGAYRRVWRRSD